MPNGICNPRQSTANSRFPLIDGIYTTHHVVQSIFDKQFDRYRGYFISKIRKSFISPPVISFCFDKNPAGLYRESTQTK